MADKVLQTGLPVGVLADSLENWPLDAASSGKFARARPSCLLMIPGISSGFFAVGVSYGFLVLPNVFCVASWCLLGLPMCLLRLHGVSPDFLEFPVTSWRCAAALARWWGLPQAAGWIVLAWLRVVETSVAYQSRGGAQCPHDRTSAAHVDHMSVTCVASHVKCLCTGATCQSHARAPESQVRKVFPQSNMMAHVLVYGQA